MKKRRSLQCDSVVEYDRQFEELRRWNAQLLKLKKYFSCNSAGEKNLCRRKKTCAKNFLACTLQNNSVNHRRKIAEKAAQQSLLDSFLAVTLKTCYRQNVASKTAEIYFDSTPKIFSVATFETSPNKNSKTNFTKGVLCQISALKVKAETFNFSCKQPLDLQKNLQTICQNLCKL